MNPCRHRMIGGCSPGMCLLLNWHEDICHLCQPHWVNGEPNAPSEMPPTVQQYVSTQTSQSPPQLTSPPSKKLPRLPDFLVDFEAAAAEFNSKGLATVEKPRMGERLATCQACDKWVGDKCSKTCCFETRVWLTQSACPLRRWPEQSGRASPLLS